MPEIASPFSNATRTLIAETHVRYDLEAAGIHQPNSTSVEGVLLSRIEHSHPARPPYTDLDLRLADYLDDVWAVEFVETLTILGDFLLEQIEFYTSAGDEDAEPFMWAILERLEAGIDRIRERQQEEQAREGDDREGR